MAAFAGDDRGDTPIFFVVFGAVVVLLYICIHGALVFHGQSVAAAAAQDALRAAQVEGGSEEAGREAAETTLAHFQGFRDVTIDVSQGDDEVSVEVRATVETPTFDFVNEISSRVSGPRERFYTETERQ